MILDEIPKTRADELKNISKNFFVNNREFFIFPNSYQFFTHIQNNLYLSIILLIDYNYSLTEKDLKSLKPFFDINIK